MAIPRKSRASKIVDVETFLQRLVHPRMNEILTLRSLILGSHRNITEHIKWNAPSFCWNGDDRITFRLQPKHQVQLIFHRGSRARADQTSLSFDDPTGLLEWAANDRGVLTFGGIDDVESRRPILKDLVVRWMEATE